ncbi:hypothetical protein J2755_001156 [Methanohalophilus levihalophilus]|uniref:DUF1284 domain-containing protein n=1 Tax=Methanohalophilus levihalophilus TaxID=1431282 RepID=UPI001AE7AFC3|nr:DUF1284 domain-containing protein [Methanohalophilus levihalophilus]MBP2030222.1 hypothetical protein [Methanohalophilus levihalophilus]
MRKIRAHHLLCMQGFHGHGYSPTFIERMKTILAIMKFKPDEEIELVACCDDICTCCPHNVDSICQKTGDNGVQIRDTDLLILKKLGFEEGYSGTYNHLVDYMKNQLSSDDIFEICGGCSWKSKCLWYLENLGLKGLKDT